MITPIDSLGVDTATTFVAEKSNEDSRCSVRGFTLLPQEMSAGEINGTRVKGGND